MIARYDATGRVLAAEPDYVYLSRGSTTGIITGDIYQVVRPTRKLTNPSGHTDVFGSTIQTTGVIAGIGGMVLKTGERASAAVVPYGTDGLYVGDAVELQ